MFLKYGNLSENTMYYTSWNREVFLEDLCGANPGVPVYVVTERTGAEFDKLNFTFGEYSCGEETVNESETSETEETFEYGPAGDMSGDPGAGSSVLP
jgi:hypothetical protein